MPEVSSRPPPVAVAAVIDRRYNNSPARLLLGLIRLYQRVLSPVPPALFGAACGCRFSPTCSHYAAEAVRTHGALGGSWLALRRLAKCTPLHRGGFDPVPQVRLSCQAVLSTPLSGRPGIS